MRLIDADELKTAFPASENSTPVLIASVRATINHMPTIELERMLGRWEFYEDRAPVWDIAGDKTWARAYKCSECGFVHSVIEDFGRYGFCPNCGADMREVSE